MRKSWLAYMVLLTSVSLFSQTVTVTADLKDVFQNPTSTNAKVCFSLIDASGNPIQDPRTSGGVLIATETQCVKPDNTGHISTILTPNDLIVPSNTQYSVQQYYLGQYVHGDNFTFNSTTPTYNLNTATPNSTSSLPVVPQPSAGATSQACTFTNAVSTWTCSENMGTTQVMAVFRDANGVQIFPDKAQATDGNTYVGTWLQPQSGSMTVFNVGQWTPSLQFPNYLVANPTAPQTITGQVLHANGGLAVDGDVATTLGGSLSAKRFEGCRQADQFSGADIGAQIVAAATDAPSSGGCLHVPPKQDGTCWQFNTAINFGTQNKNFRVDGDNTCIQWTANTGTMVTVNSGNASGQQHNRSWGFRGIRLVGPNWNESTQLCTSLTSVTATGLLLGGTNGGEGFFFEDGAVRCFGTDINYSNNTWATHFKNDFIGEATTTLNIPSGTTNAGEQLVFDHVSWGPFSVATASCSLLLASNAGVDITFANNSFDNVQVCNNGVVARFSNPHFEWGDGASGITSFYKANGGLAWFTNAELLQDNNPIGVTTAFIENTGGGTVIVSGIDTSSPANVPYLVSDSGASNTFITGNASFVPGWANVINHTGTGRYSIDVGPYNNHTIQTSGGLNFTTPSGFTPDIFSGGSLGWNINGQGETDFINHNQGIGGGWQFYLWDGANKTLWANISGKGQLSLPGSTSGTAVVNAPATGGVSNTLPSTAGTLTVTIASGSVAMPTSAVASGACVAASAQTATGVTTSDSVSWAYNSTPAANPGQLVVAWSVQSGTVTPEYCNPSAGSITPSAATLNWRVIR